MTLPSTLDALAREYDIKVAIDGLEQLTFSELRDRSLGVAAALQSAGVRFDSKVAILGGNSADWITVFFGVLYAGATAVGINTWYTASEIEKVLSDSGARFLIVLPEPSDPDGVLSVIAALQEPPQILFKDQLAIARTSSFIEPRESAAAAVIVYTSGSTAAPKGVVLTHASLIRNARSIVAAQGLDASDRVWSHFPFFFSGGLCNFLLGGLLSGATLAVHARLETSAAMQEVQSGACTVMHCWPNVIRGLIDQPEFDPSRVRSIRKGTWPVDLWFGAAGFPNLRGVNLYGLTETCTMFTATGVHDSDEIRRDTHGLPFAGNEVRIVGDDGRQCDTGEIGEIRLKGPTVMERYHGHPLQTAFDSDGYLLTQDIGELRDDGRLIWHGRSDDMIRTNGINVSPVEVETVLESVEGVQRAGVTGLPDERRGQRVIALVGVDPRSTLDEAYLLQLASTKLAPYKTPREIRFVDARSIPTTGSGKIDRRRLRELAGELIGV